MRNPKILETNESVPTDIKIVPTISVIGETKTGKTTLAESLHKKMGLIKLSIQNIV